MEPPAPIQKPVTDLISELWKISDTPLDENVFSDLKHNMRMNPFRPALRSIFCDIKSKKGTTSNRMIRTENAARENEERLDTMLKNEGIIGPDKTNELADDVVGSDRDDYLKKLSEVRHSYESRVNFIDKSKKDMLEAVGSILHAQTEFRPISQEEIAKLLQTRGRRIDQFRHDLKQSACEAVIHLRKRYFDARRKRRNFSKSSTDILNEYFQANIDYPYPSEEVKQSLALQCNISVAQVSNWFGNKRIRYKKTNKIKEEDTRRTAVAMSSNPYGFMPNTLAGMMNPYQMMMPNMAGFNFPANYPNMMAQYQQSAHHNNQMP
ncbi:unnamed protein product [Caenorhabditis sp. 36 PRJEB53466]|nr:unnamed protein product [Caenorhabditis sp. 36 PRJEB53466]